MTNDTIAAIGILCSILFAYIGYQKGLKNESIDNGKMQSDVSYIKRRTDDVLLEQKDMNKNINMLTERVAKVETLSLSAHKRIDKFQEEMRGKV